MYVELSDLQAEIPLAFLTEALDDNEDGTIDAWTAVAAASSRAVDAHLGMRYSVPFAEPYPAIVREAAFLFAAEACYTRRGVEPDKNPFYKRANDLRTQLRQIGRGEAPLTPDTSRKQPSVSAITAPARTHSDNLSL